MQKVKMGVYDEEQEYATHLTAYLQKQGQGRWELSAFSDEEVLHSYLEHRPLDLVIGTDRRGLMKIGEGFPVILVWLRSEKEDFQDGKKKLYSIYRFQSADVIYKYIEGIVCQEKRGMLTEKSMIAIYSPVGRCGKTELALDIVRSGIYGRWLYIGMEDYSSFGQEGDSQMQAEEILYYWKERRKDKLLLLLEQGEDVIATGQSFYNTKTIQDADIHWFKEVLQETDYRGAVLDIGSGMLDSLEMFREFSDILIPYVQTPPALTKRQNFEKLLNLQRLEDCRERMHFVDMDKKQEKLMMIQKLFGGNAGDR